MYWFKKVVRAILNLLPVFFVVFLTTNVNAAKYDISSFDIGNQLDTIRVYRDNSSNSDVYGSFMTPNLLHIQSKSEDFPDGFTFPHTYNFSGTYNSSSRICELDQYSDGVGSLYGSGDDSSYFYPRFDSYGLYPWGLPFDFSQPLTGTYFFGDNGVRSSSELCNISAWRYVDKNEQNAPIDMYAPKWDWSSLINIPLVNDRFKYEDSKPYYYNYNKLIMNASTTSEGIQYDKKGLKMSDIFKVKVPEFHSLGVSFTLFDDPTTWLDLDDGISYEVNQFEIRGSIRFDEEFTMGNNPEIKLTVDNYYNPYFDSTNSAHFIGNSGPNGSIGDINGVPVYQINGKTSTISCTFGEAHTSNGASENRLDFSCPYIPGQNADAWSNVINFSYLRTHLSFGDTLTFGPYTGPFFTTTGDYQFQDFYVITNNSDIYAGWSATDTATGGNLSSAPGGIVDSNSDSAVPNFEQSLKNLFNFTFINPFAPLFQMFTDNSSCVSIPIIAGMLHSDETQVCPWFDSSVRNIVTPVLGISSMMLVFGFAVRWLGSRSGNFVEDSGGVDSGGFHFQNKFRRK